MNTILAFALKHRVLMVVLFVMTLGGGVGANPPVYAGAPYFRECKSP